jgi:hypothetical protein
VASETDIINVGLRHVGAERITSRTDGTKGADVANDVYDELLDDLLRGHPWNFATKRKKLAQSSTEPIFEFDYAYPLPSDWLRTISVHDNDAGYGAFLYRMEQIETQGGGTQRAIVTSADDVWLRYITRVKDPNLMTPDFRVAFEYALADVFAIPLASSNSLQEKMEKKAARKLAKARSTDALGAPPERRPRGSWAASRGGWRRRRDLLHD